MAKDFRHPDRDQSFLLPPDMRQWLPDGHLVWFMLDVLDQLDVSQFEATSKLGRAGRSPFAPRTLLGVLLYGYAHGQRSTRQLERLCEVDVAFKVLTGNEVPDHTTLARFRQRHERALEDVFTQVLVMCAKAGLGRLGVVAIDGTKIAANASARNNVSEQKLRERCRQQAAQILTEAADADAAEDAEFGDARGDELPPSWSGPKGRQARIRQILAEIDADRQVQEQQESERSDDQQQRAETYLRRLTDPTLTSKDRAGIGQGPASVDKVAVAQARLDRELAIAEQRHVDHEAKRAAAAARGYKLRGKPVLPPAKVARVRQAQQQLDAARRKASATAPPPAPPTPTGAGSSEIVRNLTDPHSRLMPTSSGGWVQGYNCQLAVSDDQIILVATAVQSANDLRQLIPMMAAAQAAADLIVQHRPTAQPNDGIGLVVADAGYQSNANLTAPGPNRLIALGTTRDQDKQARDLPAYGDPPVQATPRERMAHRLRTTKGAADYKRRGVTVEPVNGHLKDRIGLRTFSRRGLPAANSELNLAGAVANLMKIYRARTTTG